MTIRIIELLKGYTLILVLNKNILNWATTACTSENTNGTTKAICTNRDFLEIPQNLSENIDYLDLSGSKFSSLMTSNSFKKYKKLKWLSLRECKFTDPDLSKNVNKDEDVFKSLEHLEYLDLSGLNQNGFPNYKWPQNIKNLKVNKTRLSKKLDATSILMLEYVDVSDTEITSFPMLNTKSPVKVVVMNHVNAFFTAEDIAPYCHITTIEMALGRDSDIFKPNHFCDCQRLISWKAKNNIMTNNPLCQPDAANPVTCDISDQSFTECINMRRKCFGEDTKSAPIFLIFCVLFLIGLVAITTAIAYRYARLRYHFKPVDHNVVIFNEEEEEIGEDEAEMSPEPV